MSIYPEQLGAGTYSAALTMEKAATIITRELWVIVIYSVFGYS
jgi:hypothetical protein